MFKIKAARLAITILAIALMVGCAVQQKDQHLIKISQSFPESLNFICTSLGEKDGIPENEVTLNIADFKFIIDTINTCEIIAPENYASHDIPGTSIDACGGWFAGGGTYFYLHRKENILDVYMGWQDEEQEDEGYHYEIVKQFQFMK